MTQSSLHFYTISRSSVPLQDGNKISGASFCQLHLSDGIPDVKELDQMWDASVGSLEDIWTAVLQKYEIQKYAEEPQGNASDQIPVRNSSLHLVICPGPWLWLLLASHPFLPSALSLLTSLSTHLKRSLLIWAEPNALRTQVRAMLLGHVDPRSYRSPGLLWEIPYLQPIHNPDVLLAQFSVEFLLEI